MTTTKVPSDIEIARQAVMQPIPQVAAKLGIEPGDLEPYGHTKAKVTFDFLERTKDRPMGKLILVTAISPTPAGEGKTTTSVGLADAMNELGVKTALCLREPSLGPCFGMKGGAAGGGYAQVVPMEDINLHFTGDFHAIGLAHNLLAATLDNHIHWGHEPRIDPRRVVWKRVVDMNDRALRNVIIGLGGVTNSFPRESSFDITVASEVMAIFCLSESLEELKERLAQIIVAYDFDKNPVTARQLKTHGAMTVLLREALKPNLVQTLENNPAFIHGGPFANIAHGCNSVLATKLAMRLADYTITEAGFGADLGAEKFINIKCRKAGIAPDAVVIVATVRALKSHGGVAIKELGTPNVDAVANGMENLEKHIANVRQWGLPAVVAINMFPTDTPEEVECIRSRCQGLGVAAVPSDHWARGSEGALDLARAVVDVTKNGKAKLQFTYPDDMPLLSKVRAIAQKVYGAGDVLADKKLRDKFKAMDEAGYGKLPICMAKTQYSLSTDPLLKGWPKNFDVPLRDAYLAAGAGFVVVLTGDIMTMPGLPRVPAAESIDIDETGQIVGLF
ncbi:MAG: formate--tetrahydrofolate ligase [Phycisphaeraceae bacterium]|nr:formate--tetrahydrofolate ligase [Phycisphaeraceae bacterium]